MTSMQKYAPLRIPDNIWPWSIVGFFVFLAIFNGFLVYWAVSNKPALVESSPYEKGMKYQLTIDAIRNANNIGLKVTSRVDQLKKTNETKPNYLYFATLTSEQKDFIDSDTEVIISARHASRPDLDFAGKLLRRNENTRTFTLPLVHFSAGIWLLDIEVLKDGAKYRIRKTERLS